MHERVRSFLEKVFSLPDLDAKSDLKIMPDEISEEAVTERNIYCYLRHTVCVLMNKRLISSSANNRTLYQVVNPSAL